MKSRLLGGAVAVVLAIIGIVMLATYVQAADLRAQNGMKPVEVLIVQKAVPAGTTVDQLKDAVKAAPVPQSTMATGAVTDLSQFAGKVAGVALVPGEQLLSTRLVDPTELAAPGQVAVPKGLEEITLKLDAERVAGNDLKAGDKVGIFISYNTGVPIGTQDNPATKLEFHQVLVTRVGTGTNAPGQTSGSSPAPNNQPANANGTILVTLAQSGADAVRTVHGAEFGKIYLSKENADSDATPVAPLTKDGVFK